MPSPRLPDLRPPNPESWQRAVAYRINNSAGRTTAKRVERHRKKKNDGAGDSDGEGGSRLPGNRLGSPGNDDTAEIHPEDDEAVLQDEEEEFIPHGTTEEHLYAIACKRLGIVPAAGLVRCLEADELILRNRALGPKGAQACAIVLTNNVNVRKFDLGGNDIANEGVLHVADMLRENSTITDLENCIETEGIKVLCSVLKDYGRINVLDLSGNNLQERDARYISDMLEENRTIRELYLAHNAFAERAAECLAAGLANNDAIELLDISWNHLRLHGAAALVLSLQEESCIVTLNLSWNGLHVEGCKALGEVLANNSTITYLDISSNRINSTALQLLLVGLKKNCSLGVLKLAHNPITTEGAMSVLQVLEERGDELPIREIDFGEVCVDAAFIKQLKHVRQTRILSVKHGLILKTDDLGLRDSSDPFDLDDPMMVLMEFMRIRNLRLVDLFSCLDKDGSKSISRDEFKDGLMSVNIPLSKHALDELIDRLDSNGDGEVDFSELLDGQKEHKRNIKRILSRAGHGRFFDSKTDLGRINTKIRALMAMTSLAARARHRNDPQSVADVVKAMAGHLMDNRAARSELNSDEDKQSQMNSSDTTEFFQ